MWNKRKTYEYSTIYVREVMVSVYISGYARTTFQDNRTTAIEPSSKTKYSTTTISIISMLPIGS